MFKQGIGSIVSDLLLWVFQVVIGVGTKLALESRRRHITRKYVITSFIIASFVGYVTDRIFTNLGYNNLRGVAVAIMALVSESIVRYFDENAGVILDTILRRKLDIDKDGTRVNKKNTTTTPKA